jgi:hypothetical protein
MLDSVEPGGPLSEHESPVPEWPSAGEIINHFKQKWEVFHYGMVRSEQPEMERQGCRAARESGRAGFPS